MTEKVCEEMKIVEPHLASIIIAKAISMICCFVLSYILLCHKSVGAYSEESVDEIFLILQK